MGQTGSSHQHHHGKVRNEFMKGNSHQSYPNQPNQAGTGMSSTQSAINYDYHNDMEDEELSYPPIFPTKDSYVSDDLMKKAAVTNEAEKC